MLIWLREALRGRVGLAMEAAAPTWRAVDTTCSATRAPAAISAMLEARRESKEESDESFEVGRVEGAVERFWSRAGNSYGRG